MHDPITLEIIRQRLLAVPELIDKNISRTAFSPIIADYKDYAVGIVDPEGRLIAQCKGGITVFVANALGVAVRDGLQTYGRSRIFPGDILITNHAGTMGQHLNNVVMYTPIFCSDEEDLFGFMAIVFHWMDIGGAIVGSCVSNTTTDIYQEGIQFRSVKLVNRGVTSEEILRIIQYNTRFPEMVLGDVQSQIAGCVRGKAMVGEIIARYGAESVREAVKTMWHQSEQAARRAISSLPNGVYTASSFLDDDGINVGRRVPIEVVVVVEDEALTVDLSGIADQLPGPLNSGLQGGAIAAVRIACKYLLTPDEPANDGAFRPLRIVIPERKFLSASHDAPMGGSGSTLPTVIDTIIRAFADVSPDIVNAGHHGTFGIHMFYGRDPHSGHFFKHSNTAIGGWGASSSADGEGPFRSMIHADTFEIPVEMQEAMFPVRIDSFALRPDSGGAGQQRGGLGIERIYTALAPMSFQASFERSKCPPWGLFGAQPGKPGHVEVIQSGRSVTLTKGQVELAVGDRVIVRTGGGGGYGDPTKRPAALVARDLLEGYITEEGRRDYEAAGAEVQP